MCYQNTRRQHSGVEEFQARPGALVEVNIEVHQRISRLFNPCDTLGGVGKHAPVEEEVRETDQVLFNRSSIAGILVFAVYAPVFHSGVFGRPAKVSKQMETACTLLLRRSYELRLP